MQGINLFENGSSDMDPLMRAIKAVHSMSAGNDNLARQRQEMEAFSRLIPCPKDVSVTQLHIGEILCEKTEPAFPHRKDRVIMYCHGGGYTAGGINYARILGAKLSHYCGLKVYSFEYALAPENPYPSAIKDAMKVWNHLMYAGYGAKDVVIAGDSAGGNLALEVCINLKEQERFLPRALVLMSPWTDMKIDSPSYGTWKDKDPILTREYVVSVRDAYTEEGTDYGDPHFSPLFADLKDFPQTLIQVGSNEILRHDSEKLAKNMLAAGVHAKIEIYKGGWHVFQQMPISKAGAAMESVGRFLNEV